MRRARFTHAPAPDDGASMDPLSTLIRAALRAELAPLLAELQARPEPQTGPDMLTLAEAAEVARCSPSTLRRAIATGRLQATRLGHGGSSRVLVARAELERMLAGGAR